MARPDEDARAVVRRLQRHKADLAGAVVEQQVGDLAEVLSQAPHEVKRHLLRVLEQDLAG